MASFNYSWVVSSAKVFQLVGSFMINKPNDLQPNDGQALSATKIIQSNPTGKILGSLTTTALEGGFGAIDTSHRSMIYLSPSMTFFVKDKLGQHEFRGGADLYPNIANKTSSMLAPVEVLFPPAGNDPETPTCCSSATFCAGSTAALWVANDAYERHYAAYFQD